VQPLTAIDFEGCGPEVQVDYCIKYTELCVLIARVLRERFGLRVTPELRKTALDNADESMANWCLNLPDSLQMRSGDMDLWPASLHLTYNNFLILLHRPQPRTTQGFDDCSPNDADICSTAANAITTIFDNLRGNYRLKYLWMSAVNSLFTAMIQVSVELRFSNPVLAINARRRFNSNLCTLRQLAEYWIIAESTLRLFEESSSVKNGLKLSEHAQEQSSSESRQKLQAPKRTPNGRLQRESERGESSRHHSHLDILAAAANAAVERINAGVIELEQEEVSDWRQLFPFNEGDSNQDGTIFNTDVFLMENEWREMYWQDPGFSASFGDGIGFWP
jgi:transcriptional regulatory protein AMDR